MLTSKAIRALNGQCMGQGMKESLVRIRFKLASVPDFSPIIASNRPIEQESKINLSTLLLAQIVVPYNMRYHAVGLSLGDWPKLDGTILLLFINSNIVQFDSDVL